MDGGPIKHLIVSICGASGAGKSRLAKAVVAGLGDDRAVRIPGDYYLSPAAEPLPVYLTKPIAYDWPLLAGVLAMPDGTALMSPNFDFTRFERVAGTGGRPFTMRPIALLDTIYPYPDADLTIRLTAPDELRHARIAARDIDWGTNVVGRWQQLEASRQYLEALPVRYDLVLAGEDEPEQNAAEIIARLPLSRRV